MTTRMRTTIACAALVLLAAACGPKDPPPNNTPSTSSAPDAAATPAVASTGDAGAGGGTTAAQPAGDAQAHRLLILTTACWFGGVWGDAEGDPKDMRKSATEGRCHEVLSNVNKDDKEHLEQLRALEGGAVDLVGARIADIAKDDKVDSARKDALDKLYKQVAAAQKEGMDARRAATRVKRDLDKEPEKLSADEAAAVAPLRANKELAALLALDVGDLTAEAHALGLLCAMDRLTLSRGLPKHLKIYAFDGAAKLLFNVAAPEVPMDATKPVKKGQYLAYVSDVAKAAGHPVPDTAKTPKEKEPLAWAGTLEGFADKLKADQSKLSQETPLFDVVDHVAKRLETEYNFQRKVLDAKQAAAAAPAASGSAAPKAPPPKK
jgi:hypothetical protein